MRYFTIVEKIGVAIRWASMSWFLWQSYFETGPATTVIVGWIVLSFELKWWHEMTERRAA